MRHQAERSGLFDCCGDHKGAKKVALLKDQHRWNAALDIELVVMHKQHTTYGDGHPAVLQSQYSLAQVYLGLKKFDDAERYVELARSAGKSLLGALNPFTLRADGLAAAIRLERGLLRDAEELALAVSRRQAEVLGADNLDTLDTRRTLGRARGILNPQAFRLECEQDVESNILANRYFALEHRLGAGHALTAEAELDLVEHWLDFLL
jgi:hypothetical protein